MRVQLCRRLCSSEPMFHTGQSLNAEPRALGLGGAPHPGGDGGWLAQGLLPHTQREAGHGRPKSSWRPLPSHSWNFSKMQIPLQSMQTNPRSQGCLPWGQTTTTTTTGPTGPPSLGAWLGDWSQPESLPASQPQILSLPWGTLAPGWLRCPGGSRGGVRPTLAGGPWREKALSRWALGPFPASPLGMQ